ncbi:MAG: putative toxin-antitoxin system toxin component, PIN family, partial [Terracidiphilus sp.]
IPSRALYKAQERVVLASDVTQQELTEVMDRSRFDRYVEREIRRRLVAEYLKATVAVEIPFPIRACRDRKDDKFLEVAVHGRADLIVTGDRDLLELHPFRGIAILTPEAYLELE